MRRLRSQRRVREEPKRPKTVVRGNHHNAQRRESRTERRELAIAGAIGTTMKEDDHRQSRPRREFRRPDVEVQAVFTPDRIGQPSRRKLGARWGELHGFSRAGPGARRLRRLPAQIADRRSRIRNTEERRSTTRAQALQHAVLVLTSGAMEPVSARTGQAAGRVPAGSRTGSNSPPGIASRFLVSRLPSRVFPTKGSGPGLAVIGGLLPYLLDLGLADAVDRDSIEDRFALRSSAGAGELG